MAAPMCTLSKSSPPDMLPRVPFHPGYRSDSSNEILLCEIQKLKRKIVFGFLKAVISFLVDSKYTQHEIKSSSINMSTRKISLRGMS